MAPIPSIGRDELDALRAEWRLLCEHPHRDDLAARLENRFYRDFVGARDALLIATTGSARGEAVGRLLRDALVIQLMRERKSYKAGPYALELRRRLGGASADDDPDEDEAEDNEPAPPMDPQDPFLAWRLGDRAEEAPPSKRAEFIDRAIDAFDAIALAPIDPGNDLGPFTRIADLMDENQVRRALAVTERMAGADWGLELSYARAYLLAQLAAVGRVADAEARIPTIADPDARAFAVGSALGHRVRLDLPWTFPAKDADGEPLLRFVDGLTRVLAPPAHPPPEALAQAAVARACAQPDQALRDATLNVLVECWGSVGAIGMWLAAIDASAGGPTQVDMLFALALDRQSHPAAPAIVQSAIAKIAELPSASPARWLDEVYAVRALVPLADAVALFVSALERAVRGPRSWLLQELHFTHDVEGLLRWLGGDDALAAGVRALDEVEWLLS